MNLKVDESVIHEELNLAWAGQTDTIASASLHACKSKCKDAFFKSAVAMQQLARRHFEACNTFSVKLLSCKLLHAALLVA